MQREVDKMEKDMGWDKTDADKIIKFIKKDAKEINASNVDHKVVDLIVECVQLANRRKLNISVEVKKHIKEAKKKYGGKK